MFENENPGIENASKHLFNAYSENVKKVRQLFFSSIEKDSISSVSELRNIYYSKNNKNEDSFNPVMYEMLPWILKDIANSTDEFTTQISVSWLCIYTYIMYLDDIIDGDAKFEASKIITTSLLSNKGILNLFKEVSGTIYEKEFIANIDLSAQFQIDEIRLNKVNTSNDYEKLNCAKGKNRILYLCALAFLAKNTKKENEIIFKILSHFSLCVQMLDDLADIRDDFKKNNITFILNEINTQNKRLKKNELLKVLIENGSLLRTLSIIEESLSSTILLLTKTYISKFQNTPSFRFISSLHSNVSLFKSYVYNVNKQKITITELRKTKVYLKSILLHS